MGYMRYVEAYQRVLRKRRAGCDLEKIIQAHIHRPMPEIPAQRRRTVPARSR